MFGYQEWYDHIVHFSFAVLFLSRCKYSLNLWICLFYYPPLYFCWSYVHNIILSKQISVPVWLYIFAFITYLWQRAEVLLFQPYYLLLFRIFHLTIWYVSCFRTLCQTDWSINHIIHTLNSVIICSVRYIIYFIVYCLLCIYSHVSISLYFIFQSWLLVWRGVCLNIYITL